MPNADAPTREVIEGFRQRAATDIARHLLRFPEVRRRGIDMLGDSFAESNLEPTPEQLQTVVKSGAVRSVVRLVGTAYAQGGESRAEAAMECAIEFFVASGMIYRLRVIEMENQKRAKKLKPPPDTVLALFPSTIHQLWSAPHLEWARSPLDQYSMEGVDRDGLRATALRFFQTGTRCPWYEKMLIECLIAAELYGATKGAKQNPELLVPGISFSRRTVASWALDKSGGAEPKYSLLISAGMVVIRVVEGGALLAAGWYAFDRYETKQDLWSGALLMIVALTGAVIALRWGVRRIARWVTRPMSADFAVMHYSRYGLALAELEALFKAATASPMSVSLVREVAGHAYRRGGAIDQIVVPFLDRAIAEREFLWGAN